MEHCNGRRSGFGHLPKMEPGAWGGEEYCKRSAGWGTDRTSGRCRDHAGRPIKHGRYSSIDREEISDLIQKFEEDDDPLDILPELAAARALLQDFIERYDEYLTAVIAWHEDNDEKPKGILDISEAIRFLEKVTKMAHRERRLQQDNAVSRDDLKRVLVEMARTVETELDDDEAVNRIKDRWSNIQIG